MSPLLLALSVSLAAPDAAFDEPDASVFSAGDPRADLAWVELGRAQAVWVDARRDRAFGMERRRAGDLWANQLFADGGLDFKAGEILCPAATNEFFSSARIASSRLRTWVAWRVTFSDRDVIRASQLTASGLDCDNTVYDPGPGVRLGSLQLEESGGAFMLLFETRFDVFALPLDLTVSSPVPVLAKSSLVGPYKVDPSLAGRGDGGFSFALSDNGTFLMIDVDVRGTAEMAPPSPWPGFILDSRPVLAGAPLRAAFVGHEPLQMIPNLKVGVPTTSAAPESGAIGVVPPLLVSVERTSATDPSLARTRVTARQNGVWTITDFTPGPGGSITFPAGEPLAAAGTFNRTAWFSDLGGEYAFTSAAGATGSAGSALTSVTTKSDSSQLQHSVVWLDAGVFAVGYAEGPNLFQPGAVSPDAGNVIARLSTWSTDGGVYRLHPRPSGPGLAVSLQTSAGTTVALTTFSNGQLSGAQEVLRTPVQGLDEAIVGENQIFAWARGGNVYVSGQGTSPIIGNAAGVSLGRCGARAEGQLLVPYVNGAELKIMSLADQANAPVTSRVVRNDALGVEAPCLTAYGRELLIVANDARGELRVWKTTVDDVLLNRQAVEVAGLPPRPGSRAVKNPVALGTAAGWQLAWEATIPEGGAIFESSLPFDGGAPQGGIVEASLESRVPLLAAAPTGEIVVVWQQFVDIIGAVQVRSQRIDRLPPSVDAGLGDAGVAPTDAGLEVDGGVVVDAGTPDGGTHDGGLETDAGTPDAGTSDAGVTSDGGVTPDAGVGLDGGTGATPFVFSACGCGPSGDPALLLFGALLFLSARRRAAHRK